VSAIADIVGNPEPRQVVIPVVVVALGDREPPSHGISRGSSRQLGGLRLPARAVGHETARTFPAQPDFRVVEHPPLREL